MPFVITDQEEEVTESKPTQKGRFVIDPPKEESRDVFGLDRDPEDFLRSLNIGVKEFSTRALENISTAFGGGEGSLMQNEAIQTNIERQAAYDKNLQDLEAQGVPTEEAAQQLGNRPDLKSVEDVIDESTGGTLIPKTDQERYIAAVGGGIGDFVSMDALFPGAKSAEALLKTARTGGLFGLGEQIADESGGGTASKIATGITFASLPFFLKKGAKGIKNIIEFGKGLLKSPELEGVPKFLTEKGTPKALADIELSGKDLAGRVSQTSEEMLGNFEKQIGKVAEPSIKDSGTFKAADIEKDIIKSNQKSILDTISPAAETQKKSWEGIQNVVEDNFKAARKTYSHLYDEAENLGKSIGIEAENTYQAAKALNEELKGGLVRIAEEKSLSGITSQLTKKTGPQTEATAKKILEDLTKSGVEADLKEVIEVMKGLGETGEMAVISADKLMKTKRAVNRLLRKSDIVPAPVDLLKNISKALKKDIATGLEGTRAGKVYGAAESTYAKTQDLFNNDAILKIRKSQIPEELGSTFSKPSNLEKLKSAAGPEVKVNNLIDRLIVENISNKNKATAQEMARESREFIGKKGKEGLDKMLEYGDTLTTPGQKSLTRGNILQDLQKAFDTGARPDYTLKTMKTPTGYKLVKDTLNRSPRGRKMFNSLQRMTVEDLISNTIGKDKRIDFEKAKDILSDPHMKSVIKDAMGEEGIKFFQQLENYGNNMTDNILKLSQQEPTLLNRLIDNYFSKGLKYTLWGMSPFTKGMSLLPILGADVTKRVHRNKLFNVLENPQSRTVIKKLGRKNISPSETAMLLKKFAQVSDSSSKDE